MFAPVFLRVYLPPSPPPSHSLNHRQPKLIQGSYTQGFLQSYLITIVGLSLSGGGGGGVLLHCVCGEEFGGEGWRRMEKDLVA